MSNTNAYFTAKQALCMTEDVEMYRDAIFEKILQEGGLKPNERLYPYFEQWKNIKMSEMQ